MNENWMVPIRGATISEEGVGRRVVSGKTCVGALCAVGHDLHRLDETGLMFAGYLERLGEDLRLDQNNSSFASSWAGAKDAYANLIQEAAQATETCIGLRGQPRGQAFPNTEKIDGFKSFLTLDADVSEHRKLEDLEVVNRLLRHESGASPDFVPPGQGLYHLSALEILQKRSAGCDHCLPVGPDDAEPVLPVTTGCPSLRVSDAIAGASDLSWFLAESDPDDVARSDATERRQSCMVHPWHEDCRAKVLMPAKSSLTSTPLGELSPNELSFSELGEAIREAVADSVIVGVDGFGLVTLPSGDLAVTGAIRSLCPEDRQGSLHYSCSGSLSADGSSVYTAMHCIRHLVEKGGGEEYDLFSGLAVGKEVACTGTSRLRFVTGAGFYQGDGWYPAEAVHTCQSVRRGSRDLAIVKLSDPVSRPPPRFIDDMSAPDGMITPGRRVFALGFSQSLELYQKSAGFLARNRQCADSLPGDVKAIAAEFAEEVGLPDFICTSADTYQGDSGGPIYGISDDGTHLFLLGVASRAKSGDEELECAYKAADRRNPINDMLDGLATELNALARLPQALSR